MSFSRIFGKASNRVAATAGKPITFVVCCFAVIVWGASGPLFGFTDTWQLIINTSTTIITFLMVFLIQNTQNRDGAAIQAKLDELIRSSKAQDTFIGIEHLPEEEVEEFRSKCEEAAAAHAARKRPPTKTRGGGASASGGAGGEAGATHKGGRVAKRTAA